MSDQYELVVVGGGSGGIGAALAGARAGLSTLLVEQADRLGGNAVRGGVHDWEPSVGGTGVPFDVYCRLHDHSADAVGVATSGRHVSWGDDHPGGEKVVDPDRTYRDTLRRHHPDFESRVEDEAFVRGHWDSVVFEPDAYVDVVEEMLAERDCAVATGTAFVEATTADGRITSITLDDGRVVRADVYVDSTASGVLCRACGCEASIGQESNEAFDEPHAPETPTNRVNSVTLIYRVTPAAEPGIEPLPDDVPPRAWWADAFPATRLTEYPCGDWNVNMLPTMEGAEFVEYLDRGGRGAAYDEARRRVRAHWHHLQTEYPEYRAYERSWVAPALGVRESHRIRGEYILTEHDVLAGLSGQDHGDVIAINDHALDWHSADDGGTIELDEPHGVPYRCLLPEGFENLLIASRGASFSSIAASSCRLSRTVMQLGQAAGTAAAIAVERDCDLPDVPPGRLRSSLRRQHVELDWPRSSSMETYLSERDPADAGP